MQAEYYASFHKSALRQRLSRLYDFRWMSLLRFYRSDVSSQEDFYQLELVYLLALNVDSARIKTLTISITISMSSTHKFKALTVHISLHVESATLEWGLV